MSSNECPCCFEAITSQTGQVVMACSHVFHFRCITDWFLVQESNDLPQNCPCCRDECSEIAKLPPMRVDIRDSDDESDGDDSDYDEDEEDEEEENLVYTRQQIHDVILSHGGIGVTNAIWDSWNTEENHETLSFDIDDINNVIITQGGREMEAYEFNYLLNSQRSDAEPVQSSLDTPSLTTIEIDPVSQSNLRSDAPEFVPTSLRIRWTRLENGDWARKVLNPEEEEPIVWGAYSTAPPPTSLVLQTMDAARKIQTLFRGMMTRKQVQNMRRAANARTAAAKIQALFRGHTVRQMINSSRFLQALQ